MGSRKCQTQISCQRNQRDKQADHTKLCDGAGQTPEARISRSLYKTINHFFPFFKLLQRTPDPRNLAYITYPIQNLLWIGIVMFIARLGARRQISCILRKTAFLSHVQQVCGSEVDTVAHGDTLNYLLCRLLPENLMKICTAIIRRLLRGRVLEFARLLNRYYLIAVDGTNVQTFNSPHCPHCLTFKDSKTGVISYRHSVLEAKLVTPSGMALSIATEFIENPSDRNPLSKQDCELKAFYRLAVKIKEAFPRLPICLTLDALYAAEPVFRLCEKNGWKFIVTLKPNDLKQVYEEFEALLPLQPENRHSLTTPMFRQNFEWVADIQYRELPLNVIRCIEHHYPAEQPVRFSWITNLSVNLNSCQHIAKGGRQRWIIENQGFNMQKNGGYNLEHIFSHNPQAQNNFYLLLQISHNIQQLLEYGSLLKNELGRTLAGSKKNLSILLLAEFTCIVVSPDLYRNWNNTPVRIIFNSS